MKFAYGDKVRCYHYGEGTIVKYDLPCYPGEGRREAREKDEKIKGEKVKTTLLKVRFDFDNSEMKYNRKGFRIGVNGLPDSNATLSKVL